MVTPQHLFWDSCVFTAYLREQSDSYDLDSIAQYLEAAQKGAFLIHASTISSAEVLPSQIVKGGNFEDFLQDFQGAVVPVDPNPNIMRLSGRLRDLPYMKQGSRRRLGTPDAIILATALYLTEAEGITLEAFHTFDKGKSRGEEGKKPVPMIGYEYWCEGFDADQRALADRVISLNRTEPMYPDRRLFPEKP